MTDLLSASFCSKCGRAIPPEGEFCAGCGTRIRTSLFDTPSSPGSAARPGVVDAATMLPPSGGAPAAAPTMLPSVGTSTRVGEGGFRAGDQIGSRYTILKLLGAGGMGAVYQAFDQELGVSVAIKVIRRGPQTDATAARDLELRFKRELVLARQITHKHVVRIHDIGDIEGVKYLTMPFVEGQTLADMLRTEGKLPVARALTMAKQVALGLAAAHDKGVIHRDLKPENIMIEKGEPPDGGDALIMDFGIARSVEHGGTQTAAGSVIGTIEYMAPEQGRGQTVDQRADIYSFGLIVYDALVGRQRFKSGENPMSELLGRFKSAPPPPRSLNGEVPEALDRIVGKCLEPAAENRFQTTHELVAALESLTADGYSRLEGAPTPAKPVAPPSTFDPEATFAGGPDQLAASSLDVTFAGAPGIPPGRPSSKDLATVGPTPAASGGTHKGPIEVGQQFGTRYHIIRELGVGGMGAVYQAWDAELGVAVAVKVIRPEIASNPEASGEIERRFKRELLLARQITHPNVVRIHDLGDINGIKYITMPFIEGSDLSTILTEHERLPVDRALHIARGVVAGLVSAHDAGVVHRDLKPANIMIGVDDVPTIMDFGIARSADSPQQAAVTPRGVRPSDLSRTAGLTGSATQAGAIVGTVAYMAPEQASGQPVDQRADIYAFGLILYDMLIGGRRRDSAKSAVAELVERMQTAPPAPRTIDPTIPEAVDAIVRRCLEPDAANRFQKTVDLNAAFERLDENGKPLPMIRRLTWRGMALSAAAVLLLVAGTFFVGQQSALPVEAREPLAVLIANFDNRTGDSVFDGALEQMFQLGVEGTSFITAYPRQTAQRLATEIAPGSTLDEERARLVAIREGVKVVLAGRIEPDGAGYRISMRAIDPTRGEPLASIEERAASKTDVPKTVGAVVAEVRATLGDTATKDTMLASAETFTATSLEAVRAYSLAQDLAVGGKHEEAVVKYQEAIDRDADFGRAYSGLALSLSFLGRSNEAESQWKNALSRLERMTEREKYRTLGLYYNSVTRNYEKAIESFSTLVTLYPADAAGHSNLALAYFRNLNFQKALEEGGLAVKIYPGSVATSNNYVLYAMYAGDFATASAEGARIIKEHPDFHKAYLPPAMAALADGNFTGAREAYAGMATAGPRGASLASVGLSDQAMYEGRFPDAQAILQKGIAEDQQNKNGAAMAAKYVALGEAFEAQGQVKLAVDAAERAMKLASGEAVSVAAARLFVRNGKEAAAEAIAANLGQQLQPQSRAYAKIIEGELALRRRRMVDTIEALLAAQKLADLWIGRFNLGVAYVEAGHYAEAVTELELCVKRRGEATAIFLDDVPTFRYMAPLGYWLGRAKEELGMKGAATEHYKAFLALRPSSPKDPLVVDARRRLGTS